MEQPLVSVVMPTFNDRKEFLKESIESILDQTYNNIELIIADDSTSTDSINIIDEYAQKENRIIVSRRAGRKGISAAMNDAIKIAKGEFIAHMDADDVSVKNRLELQMKCFEVNDIAVVGGRKIHIDEAGNLISDTIGYPTNKNIITFFFWLGADFIVNPTTIIRKTVLEDVGNYDELCTAAEDNDVWYKIIGKGYKIVNVPDVVLKYRIHDMNHHTVNSERLGVIHCMSHIKFALGLSRCLSKEEFAILKDIIDTKSICRLNVACKLRTTPFSRFLSVTKLKALVYFFTIVYFKVRKNYYRSLLSI